MKHEFVEYIPDKLKDGVIYISMTFGTAAHKCCCGCGNEVTTPLSPTDWKLTITGESISLYPSIGNWNFDCKSHYWIIKNEVKWAKQWSKAEINAGRHRDKLAKDNYYRSNKIIADNGSKTVPGMIIKNNSKSSFWSKLKQWWSKDL